MPSWFKGKKYNKTGDDLGENFSFVSDVENGHMMEETYSHGQAPVTISFDEQNENENENENESIDQDDDVDDSVGVDIEGGGGGGGDGDNFKDEENAADITNDTIDITEGGESNHNNNLVQGEQGEELSYEKSISMRGKSMELQSIDIDDFCCGLPGSSSNNIGSLALTSMMTTASEAAAATAEAGGYVDTGEEEEQQLQQQQQQQQQRGGGGSGKIRSIQLFSTEDGAVDDCGETTGSGNSSSADAAALDNIRCMGPIRDRGGSGYEGGGGGGIDQSSSAGSPMCMKMNNIPSGEKRSKLYWYIAVTFLCFLLAAIIGTVIVVAGNQKSKNIEVSSDVNSNNSNDEAVTPTTININDDEAEINNNNNNTNGTPTVAVAAADNNNITTSDTDVIVAKNNTTDTDTFLAENNITIDITDVVVDNNNNDITTTTDIIDESQPSQEQQQPTSTNNDVVNPSTATGSTTTGGDDRANGIKAVLAMSVPPPTDFNTAEGLSSSSPQAMAFDWIVNTDEVQLTVETSSALEITKRFAAATLYFATGGDTSWISSLGFLSNDSICSWNDGNDIGIFCNGEGETAGSPTEIKIVSNNLSGSIPNEINYFTDLETLDLYYNKLTGSIPDLSQLINLRQFDVDGNMLSGMAPESLFNLPSIVNMYLLNNKDLTGTIPNIGDSSRLEKISVLGCSFTGSIPQSLSALSTLRLLQMKDNAITGTIPAGLLSLPELETLGLHGNRLVGSIPSIDAVTGSALRSLSLGSNSLEGSLPDGIEALTALQFLYAHDNALTGTVRNEIMALPLLEQLWLYKNKLTGEIPALSSSGNLVDLFLSDNDLSGNLQDLLASAPTSIERIDVSNNDLGGFISDDIIQLTKVQTFAVAGNKLTGVIPENIMNMISLTSFDFSQNSLLEGDLTSSICKTTAISNGLIFAAADCSGGDPIRVKCDCCTECCDRSGECTPNNND